MDTNHQLSQTLLDNGLVLCENVDLSLETAKNYLNTVEENLKTQPEEEKMNQVRSGFSYWKKKFDRLDACKKPDDIAKLLEEFMFKDPDREKHNCSPLNFVQIAMKTFINAARNKLFELPRYYNNARLAIQESLVVRTKFDVMDEIMDKICKKNGYKSAYEYMAKLCI